MEANSFIMLWHASLLLQVTRTVTQIVYSEYLILLSLGLAAAQKRRKKRTYGFIFFIWYKKQHML